MATSPSLPISQLIDVTVQLSPAAAQSQSLSNLLILGDSPVIDTNTRLRTYTSLAGVATDFGSTAPEYLAAVAWFSQAPQPSELLIGRWAQTATSAELFGAPLSPTQQATLLADLQAISTGSMELTVDGVLKTLSGLNFSSGPIGNLNAAAAIIQSALGGGILCTWVASAGYFTITSGTTGASSTITFASATGSGVDISSLLQLRSTNSGAYIVQGIVAETALSAVQLFDELYGQQWYGLFICGAADGDHEAIAPYIEGDNAFHFYWVNTQEAGVLVSSSTSDIAYILAQGGYTRTAVQYSSSSLYAVVSMAARILTTDYGGNNTVITLMYKQEPTITPETLNSNQAATVTAKNANVFVKYNNSTAIIQTGITCAGIPNWIDVSITIAALAVDVQTAVYNLLYGNNTKIPQTDAGVHQIVTTIESVCTQFVANGTLAPGTWLAPGFGALNQGDYLAKGYYVYAPPVSTQAASQRAKRICVPIQVAAKLAGAIQTVQVAITVNE